MESERWDRIRALFGAAIELERKARVQFLDAQLRDDPALRREVEALLAHHEAATGFAQALTRDGTPVRIEGLVADEPERAPERIGAYRVLGVLGEGGMGVVYRAVQEHPRRDVALKVLKASATRPSSLRRFEREAEILARLRHDGIARIFEAGTAATADGPRAFFAMELVDGLTLDAWARATAPSVRTRVALVVRIARAVQHAHQQGVVHRDLKPRNVLVDAGGEPKVLDFGIARIVDREADLSTAHTRGDSVLGTLAYMSPEQVERGDNAIDTRSDVYALGVIAYELLAGAPPIDVARCSLPEAARRIRDEEPARLSRFDRALRGDLESIVAKALEKDPDRRYASAAELAADFERHLSDEPILARRQSTLLSLRRFARRRRGVLVAAGLVLMALSIGSFATWSQARAAERGRDIADVSTRRANSLARLMETALLAAAPNRSGPDVKVVDVLTDMLAALEEAPEPDEADLRATIGWTFHTLGDDATAVREITRAAELYETRGEGDTEAHLAALANLATAYTNWRRPADALPLRERVLAMRSARDGPAARETLLAKDQLAIALADLERIDEADRCFSEVSEAFRALPDEELDEDVFTALHNRIGALARWGRWKEAQQTLNAVLPRVERHPSVPRSSLTYWRLLHGQILEANEDFAEAALVLWSEYESACELFAADNRVLRLLEMRLARVLSQLGLHDDAEAFARKRFDMQREHLGPASQSTYDAWQDVVTCALRRGEKEAAAREMLELAASARRDLGSSSFTTVEFLANAAILLREVGRRADGLALQCEAMDLLETTFPTHRRRLEIERNYGCFLVDERRFDEAEPYFRAPWELARRHAGAGSAAERDARATLLRLYELWGRPELARELAEDERNETSRVDAATREAG